MGIDGGQPQLVLNRMILHFFVSGDYVYYANPSDGGILYKCQTDGTNPIKLGDYKIFYFIFVLDDMVYYNTDYGWVRVSVDGRDSEILNIFGTSPIFSGGRFYYINTDSKKIMSVDVDDGNEVEIDSQRWWSLNSTDTHLFAIDDISNYVYKMNYNGEEKTAFLSSSINNICIVGDWIFMNDRMDGILMKMKTDGTCKTVMQKLQGQ